MKKLLTILGLTLAGLSVKASAAFPPTQDRGSVELSTQIAVAASTTPIVAYSTGTNSASGGMNLPAASISTSPSVLNGQYIPERIAIEFFNDTSTDVYIGYSRFVSTQPGTNYGRRVPPQTAWSNDGSVRTYWIVSSTTTDKRFVITQQR